MKYNIVIKKALINILLVLSFSFWMLIISLNLASQYYLRKGRASSNDQEMIKAYFKASMLNPFDPQPINELAKVILKQASSKTNTSDFFEKARDMYIEALNLNPNNAEYRSALALIKIALFNENPDKYQDNLEMGIKDLKEALLCDPYGVNISYILGYTLVSIWDRLKEADQKLAIEKLKFALTYRYWPYSASVYNLLWFKLKDFRLLQQVTPEILDYQHSLYYFLRQNNLWQFRKDQMKAIRACQINEQPLIYRQKVLEKKQRIENLRTNILPSHIANTHDSPQKLWWGISEDGNHEYQNGDMYWSGTLHTILNIPPGKCAIGIFAKGSPAGDNWPYMIVELEGSEIGETFVNTVDWKEYDFEINTPGGLKVLSINYPNDLFVSGMDGNLFIGDARIKDHE